MKYLWLITFFVHHASFSDDATCKKSLLLISDLEQEKIKTLYDFKNNNLGNWSLIGERSHFGFALEPQKIAPYRLSWEIKLPGKNEHIFQDGGFSCEIPLTWQLKPKKDLQIVFPKAAHGLQEDSSLHSLLTFAGIYLAKSIYMGFPDMIRIMWHLNQSRLPEEVVSGLITSFPFVGHNLNLLENTLDKNNGVQLIALHFSQAMELDQGESRWLITNAGDQDAIRKGSYHTPESKHNMWLPWLDFSRPEFKASSIQEVHKTTIVAPLAIAKIYNRSTRSYIPDPIPVQDKMQMVYDLISPLVRARMDDNQALFTHLLLQSKFGYELYVFEILQSGALVPLSSQEIKDPSLLGLPSAQELGFSSQPLSDINGIQ
jgi:hypothetical protein